MIRLILTLGVVGFLTYLIVTYIPMLEPFKKVIIVLVVILLIIYVMGVLGVGDIAVPRL